VLSTKSSPTACVLSFLLLTANVSAEVFTHRQGAENFEAIVSAERLVVKERYQGASTIYGDLSCLLGAAVRATILPASDSRLCFTFAADQCEYTRFQDGSPIHQEELANARVPRMCIALGSADEAQRLAKLVNSGPQQARAADSAAAEESKRSTSSPEPFPKHAEPVEQARETPARATRPTQAAGSTHSAPERVDVYSSDASSRARADSVGQQPHVSTRLGVFVHVRNPKQCAEVERLIEPLLARGIRVTGIKLMDVGPLTTDLRYFHPDDARQSGEVVRVLRTLGVRPVRVKHIKGFETRATRRQYELWLSPTDSPVRLSAGASPDGVKRQR